MFRFSARDAHAWRDMAQNIGKLSLAGLFLTGSFLLAHAYASPSVSIATLSHKSSISANTLQALPNFSNGFKRL